MIGYNGLVSVDHSHPTKRPLCEETLGTRMTVDVRRASAYRTTVACWSTIEYCVLSLRTTT